jgi:hypothetical protein
MKYQTTNKEKQMLEALKKLFGKKPVVVVEPPKPVAKKAPAKKPVANKETPAKPVVKPTAKKAPPKK